MSKSSRKTKETDQEGNRKPRAVTELGKKAKKTFG